MSLYRRKFNPVPNTSLVPTANVITFKEGVANQSALPLTGNTQNDARIATDTGVLYVWNIAASSGLLTDWVSQGDITDLKWAAIEDKPTSSVTNIDDAVSKRHTQGTDQGLDTGGPNAVTAVQAKAGYTHSGVTSGNPHNVSKSDVGLGNVDNKSEATIITDVKADTDVADAISTKHSHSNKTVLDNIQEALTTVLKSSYDACVTFIANFDITSPSIDDTLVWNGSQYTNKPLKETTGQNVTYFFDDTLSGVSTYYILSKVPIGTAEDIDTVVVNNNTVLFEGYNSVALGGTEINAGVWEFTLWVGTTNAGATNFVDVEVYKRTVGGAETLLFTVSTPDLSGTSITEQNIKTAQPSFAINSTDILVVKVYGRTTGGTNRTMSFVHNGTSRYSHFHTPLILRHNDLAGIQGGTSGQYNHLTDDEYSSISGIGTTLTDLTLNIMLNAFRIAQVGSLTIFGMVKGFVDEYEDESGIDTGTSMNQIYNSVDDYYSPSFDDYTKLLLHLDNNVTDSELTPKTVTNNNVTFSAPGKFGGYAGSFNGTSSYLSVPDSADFDFGSGDFTIDFWVNFSDKSGQQAFVGKYIHPIYFLFRKEADDTLAIFITDGVGDKSYATSSPVSISNGVWYHIALIRSVNTALIFFNGVSQTLTGNTFSGALPTIATTLKIGSIDGAQQFINGQIDEFRVSKGIARWTSNFTPPTVAYVVSTDMTIFSNAQVATIVPTSARIILFEEDVDSITLNTDLKAYISRDNGTTYSQVTLEDEGNYITGAKVLSGVVDISAQPSGSNIKYKIETLNTKNLRIHGTAVSWK